MTLDAETAKGGLSDATVGTVKNAAGTVTDTAGTAGEGLKDTAGTVAGRDDMKSWWENVEARQTAFDEEAKEWFTENPFDTLLTPGTAPAEETPDEKTEEAPVEVAEEPQEDASEG